MKNHPSPSARAGHEAPALPPLAGPPSRSGPGRTGLRAPQPLQDPEAGRRVPGGACTPSGPQLERRPEGCLSPPVRLPRGASTGRRLRQPRERQSWGPRRKDHVHAPPAMAALGQSPGRGPLTRAPISAPPLGSLNMYILLHALLEYRALLTDDKS